MTFGTAGLVETAVGKYTEALNGLVIQPDGKILGIGEADFNGGKSYDFAVIRYQMNGTLDTTFGDGGVTVTDIGGGEDDPISVALLPGGKIVVAGFRTAASGVFSTTNYAVARYNWDGSLDPTFGTGGTVTVDIHGTADSAGAAALTTAGSVLIAGGSGQTTSLTTHADISAAEILSDGSLNASFGDGGKFVYPSGAGSAQANVVAFDATGRALLAGEVSPSQFALLRLQPNGSLDTTFGDSGVVSQAFSGRSGDAFAVLVQPNGKLVVAGYGGSGGSPNDPAIELVRYGADGVPDPTFGAGGVSLAIPPPNSEYGVAGAALDSCSIVTAGTFVYTLGGLSHNAMGVARFRL